VQPGHILGYDLFMLPYILVVLDDQPVCRRVVPGLPRGVDPRPQILDPLE
jgi:hypothetical protein